MGYKTAQQIWEIALGELQLQVSKQNYRTWLEKTSGISYKDGQFIVGVSNAFTAEYLDKKLRSLVEKTLIGLTIDDVKVIFQVNNHHQNTPAKSSFSAHTATPPNHTMLNARYTFDSFIAGSGNQLACAAALKVAENPGRSYNPLFIYGDVGLGKTHLLHAVGHVALSKHLNVLYVSAEKFTNEFVTALREGKIKEFHNRYRSVDMLLIDDIRFICGKEQTEETFFHTFNELHNSNRQIVITSDLPPKSLPLLQKRLRSRFEGGLVTPVEPPDKETRLAILQDKVKRQGIVVLPEALEVIAQRAERSVRQLEGLLNRVVAYARLVRTEISTQLASRAIADIADAKPGGAAVTPGAVIEAVADSFKLDAGDLASRKRDKKTALARQLAMYIMRQETTCSLTQIGQEMGGRDHSTVIHACTRIITELESDHLLKSRLLDIQHNLCPGERED